MVIVGCDLRSVRASATAGFDRVGRLAPPRLPRFGLAAAFSAFRPVGLDADVTRRPFAGFGLLRAGLAGLRAGIGGLARTGPLLLGQGAMRTPPGNGARRQVAQIYPK
jgi:hypothetical protein